MKTHKISSVNFSAFDQNLMQKLLNQSQKYLGLCSPNPTVGAAVAKDNKIISTGYHQGPGTPHAETVALKKAGKSAKGAILYVTLEPCTHWGQNPPCTDLIIKSGIKKVIYALSDPNPLVKKNPAKKILNAAGIEVLEGLLEKKAAKVNEIFLKTQIQKKPFVILKAALSLDGKIALKNGLSKYITSEKSLKKVHQIRRDIDAICVGINTIIKDDPGLNVRYNLLKKSAKNPVKIILDSHLKTPANAKIFQDKSTPTIIFTKKNSLQKKKYKTLSKLAEIIPIPHNVNGLVWDKILNKLFEKKIMSLLIEGGQKIYTTAIEQKIVDKVYLFIAPKLILGQNAISLFAGQDSKSLNHLPALTEVKVSKLGLDILITGYLNHLKV